MKTRRILPLALALILIVGMLAACGADPADIGPTATPGALPTPPVVTPPPIIEDTPTDSVLLELGLDENLRFLETRKITVAVFDRGNDGGSPPDDNVFSNWIKEQVLETHNIEIEWVRIGRWTGTDDYSRLFAANAVPDIGYEYDFEIFMRAFSEMGGILDMYPYLSEYSNIFPHLFDFLGTEFIYWNMDPETNAVYAFPGKVMEVSPVGTFMREDWLDILGLDEPRTIQEFEDCLVAFKDNAELLLGENADRMVPYMMSHDVRWQYRPLLDGYLPSGLSERDIYVNGSLEQLLTHPANKETIRTLNKWYNMGLMWYDFGLYTNETLGSIVDDRIRQGHVGAYNGNIDAPYRGGENSHQAKLQEFVGPDAAYIAISPFPNDSGEVSRLISQAVDRFIFFPSTNTEPIASLLYIDFITRREVREYLQIGEEGINHILHDNGAVEKLPATGEWIQNSPDNIDYTITINVSNAAPSLGDPLREGLSRALAFPGTDSAYVARTFAVNQDPATLRAMPNFSLGTIEAESGIIVDLNTKRNNMFVNAIVAAPADFDAVYDAGMQDLMASGLRAAVDERIARWELYYGDAEFISE
ncbi:MAG: sugar ABC transporter substrate-binding protein [Oscillospiraceae bacterium]|nr:sugar ABC transporter substrate-binding protein [Oscillospiraceae bacterium]